MEFDYKVEGFKELAAALRGLPSGVGRNLLRAGVAAGAAEVRVEARKNAEAMRRTGTLARSRYQKHIPELSNDEKHVFYVGARQGKKYQKVGKKQLSYDAYYARFVELGHFTRPSTGGRLPRHTNRGERNNAALASLVQSGHVRWVPPKPFLRPAFDVKREAAVEKIGQRIALGLLSEAQKLGLRTGQ